jgi:CP family cyanate transporter-like MFS transporter
VPVAGDTTPSTSCLLPPPREARIPQLSCKHGDVSSQPTPAGNSPAAGGDRGSLRVIAPWFVGLGILVFSANLRGAIVGVSPLIETIRADGNFSAATAGLLTTIPVLCFGLFSPLVPELARRIGIERSIFVALFALIAGILLRLVPSTFALFAGTFIIGAAIAIGNVLLPSLIKRDFPNSVGLMTGLYTMTLSAGAGLTASIVVPLMDATGWGWREILALMAIPAAVAAALWLPQLRMRHPASGGGLAGLRHLIRQPLAWWVTLFMGLQSLNYYALTAWLPALFVSHGISETQAGLLLALTNIAGIPGCLLAPIIASRLRSQSLPILVSTGFAALSIIGILVAPVPLSVAAMLVYGVAQGACLALALLLIVKRTSTASGAADLSGMSQSLGYTLAAIGPFGVGLLRDLSGAWTIPLLVLICLMIAQIVFGGLAGRDRTIPDS